MFPEGPFVELVVLPRSAELQAAEDSLSLPLPSSLLMRKLGSARSIHSLIQVLAGSRKPLLVGRSSAAPLY